MNKIDLNKRVSYDGVFQRKVDIEQDYVKCVFSKVSNKLLKIKYLNAEETRVLEYIKRNLRYIILAEPSKLEHYTRIVDLYFPGIFCNKRGQNDFGKMILKAFSYNDFRKTVLVNIARRINVKVCPYCNMHYTLFVTKSSGKRLAKFQFDHFYDKVRYPFLSMSLYNLIPSCAVCNHGKSTQKLSLLFHPYESDICKQFKFEVDSPVSLYTGAKERLIDIKLVPQCKNNQIELNKFDEVFNIKTLYQRHGDLVQEIFDKAYLSRYTLNWENYRWFASSEYLERIRKGNYSREVDIEKRPMAKFNHDIWEQAEKNILKNVDYGKN